MLITRNSDLGPWIEHKYENMKENWEKFTFHQLQMTYYFITFTCHSSISSYIFIVEKLVEGGWRKRRRKGRRRRSRRRNQPSHHCEEGKYKWQRLSKRQMSGGIYVLRKKKKKKTKKKEKEKEVKREKKVKKRKMEEEKEEDKRDENE